MSQIRRSLCVAGIVAAAVAGSAQAAVTNFNFPNFPSSSNLNLVGQAAVAGGSVVLNPAQGSTRGAVWYNGGKVEVAGGFSTRFEFRITDINAFPADGFALVIQNTSPTAIGGVGGGLGYANNPVFDPNGGITNSFAVEFDTWNNTPQWDDFAQPQCVSFQSRGLLSNDPGADASLGMAPINPINDNQTHVAEITYGEGVMTVSLDGTTVLSRSIDLANLLSLDAGTAWVGFTAATGGAAAAESHSIQSWQWNSNIPSPGTGALAVLGGLLACRRRRA